MHTHTHACTHKHVDTHTHIHHTHRTLTHARTHKHIEIYTEENTSKKREKEVRNFVERDECSKPV